MSGKYVQLLFISLSTRHCFYCRYNFKYPINFLVNFSNVIKFHFPTIYFALRYILCQGKLSRTTVRIHLVSLTQGKNSLFLTHSTYAGEKVGLGPSITSVTFGHLTPVSSLQVGDLENGKSARSYSFGSHVTHITLIHIPEICEKGLRKACAGLQLQRTQRVILLFWARHFFLC